MRQFRAGSWWISWLVCLVVCVVWAVPLVVAQTAPKPTLVPFEHKNGRWGYKDTTTGKIAIKARYDRAFGFQGERAVVCRGCRYNPYARHGWGNWEGGQWGMIDRRGREIIPVKFGWIGEPSEGLVAVSQNYRYGYLTLDGQWAIPMRYEEAEPFQHGRAIVREFGKYGLIDTRGELVLPLIYDRVDRFRQGLAVIIQDDRFGFVNLAGQVVVQPVYDGIRYFHDGRALVCQDCFYNREMQRLESGRFGYIDRAGKVVIPLIFEQAENFRRGRARVRYNKQWLTIDADGSCLTNCPAEPLPRPEAR